MRRPGVYGPDVEARLAAVELKVAGLTSAVVVLALGVVLLALVLWAALVT